MSYNDSIGIKDFVEKEVSLEIRPFNEILLKAIQNEIFTVSDIEMSIEDIIEDVVELFLHDVMQHGINRFLDNREEILNKH